MWYINGRVVSLPLTDMRYINGWVESVVLRRKAEDFSVIEDRQMKKTGFYIIKDKFFEDMLIRISKGIRQETGLIITVLKIRIPEYIG